jgi:hypothetical protein
MVMEASRRFTGSTPAPAPSPVSSAGERGPDATEAGGSTPSRGTECHPLWTRDREAAGSNPNGRKGNHSCDPNLWWVDAYTLAARRDRGVDEELTNDYATSTAGAGFDMHCRC